MTGVFYGSYALMWLVLLAEGVLLLLLYRHVGLIAMSSAEGHDRDGLAISERAPVITGVRSDDSDVRWQPGDGVRTALLFVSPGCGPCEEVIPHFDFIATRAGDQLRAALVAGGPSEVALALERERPLNVAVIADDGSGAFDAYRVKVTPFLFVTDAEGRVTSKGLCSDLGRMLRLLEEGDVDVDGKTDGLDELAAAGGGLR